MKVILKSYKENRNKGALYNYCTLLEQKGWRDYILEGGYVSPDWSTIFVYGRAPYEGQLMQYSEDREDEFLAIVQELLAAGVFVEL